MSPNNHANHPVAIIGMECRLPGADSVDVFWKNVREGICSLGPVPEERLDRSLYFDPGVGKSNKPYEKIDDLTKTYTDLGGVIRYRPVDRSVCPMTDRLEEDFDVAHLNLCEVASRACLDAGLDPWNLPLRNTGIYIGNTRGGNTGSEMVLSACLPDALRKLESIDPFRAATAMLDGKTRERLFDRVHSRLCGGYPKRRFDGGPFTGANAAASLISQSLKTNGPCLVFNAACASSLQALFQAVQALRLGSIDMALVGGASYFHSDTLALFSFARSLTRKRSCPFDEEADGLIVGEGAVVLALKRLDRALADGDRIRAVIREVGAASDGKGKSLWAPRKEGQIEAMRRTYLGDITPAEIGYIEAHATSTALGDATETEALVEFFGPYFKDRKIPLGSSKGNVGHTLEVAGLTGLLKAVLGIERRIVPPVAGLKKLNDKIDWPNIPFYVPTKETEWTTDDDALRRAAVNSFGIGGLNVHVVVEEFRPENAGRPNISVLKRIREKNAEKTTPSRDIARKNSVPIAIVGYGGILPGSLNMEELRRRLAENRPAIRAVSRDKFDEALFKDRFFPGRHDPPCLYGGFVDGYRYDWKKNKVPPKQIENANPLQFMILDAVNEAWESSRIDLAATDRKRVGVIVGTAFGGDFAVELAVTLFLPEIRKTLGEELRKDGVSEREIASILSAFSERMFKDMPALLDETGSFTASALASRITKTFDLMGGAVALDAEAASATAALGCCIDQLRTGMNDMMVCISGQQDLGAGVYEMLAVTERLPDDPERSPFDRSFRNGAPGEGCGALILKRYDDAIRDGDPIHAVIDGFGVAGNVDPRMAHDLALKRSYADGGWERPEPDFLEVAATNNIENTVALLDAFTRRRSKSTRTSLGAMSHRVGHLGSAAGMASLLKSIVVFTERKFPSDHGLRELAPHVARYRDCVDVPTETVRWNAGRSPKSIVVNAGDFNIYNVLLREPAPEH